MNTQNLIQNGSFENFTYPADWNNWSGQFINYSETPVKRILFSWDEFNSADFLTSSCTHTFSGVPENRFGYITPKDGINVVGIQVFPNVPSYESKEYIYQQLTSPLQAGKIYYMSFYVSRADRKDYSIKNIGAFFSNNAQSTGSLGYIVATPQIINQSGFITDTVGWTQIQGYFTANGGEQYITIGNFNSNANTDTLYVGTNNPIASDPEYAYYYIDDITLIDQTTVGIMESKHETSKIYPNPANCQINFDFKTEIQSRKIELYDALGNLVLKQNAKEKDNNINIQSLQNGIYYYRIIVENKTIKSDKIVVIK